MDRGTCSITSSICFFFFETLEPTVRSLIGSLVPNPHQHSYRNDRWETPDVTVLLPLCVLKDESSQWWERWITTEENHGFLHDKSINLRHFLNVFLLFNYRFNQLLPRASEPVDRAQNLLPLVRLAVHKWSKGKEWSFRKSSQIYVVITHRKI